MADYLLIDFGSTNIKYALYNVSESKVLIDGAFPFPDKLQNDNELIFEADPKKITDILSLILNSITLNSLNGIIISVQMHGYILTDSGRTPITPYISWRDRRSLIKFNDSKYYDIFKTENIIWSERGTSCKANLPLISLFAQRYLYPNLLKEGTEFFTLGSYIAYTLTGNNASHITDCAATGMYNAETCEQMEDYEVKIPKAFKNVEILGCFKGIPVYSPVGDHQASFLGCGVKDGQYLLNIGTAAQLSTLSYEKSEFYECRPYFDGRSLCTITGLIGGHVIKENPNIKQQLIDNYSSALKRLQKKDSLLVCGGAASHFPNLINEVCMEIGLPYQIQQNNSAINGLKKIAVVSNKI